MSAVKAVATAAAGGLILAGVTGHVAVPALSAPAATTANASGIVAYADQEGLRKYGWGASEDACLYTLWQGESGWSQYADTETTGLTPPGAPYAYGIPQAYPSTKLPLAAQSASAGGSSSARVQVRWGEGYVETTYSTPCNALASKRAHGNKGY